MERAHNTNESDLDITKQYYQGKYDFKPTGLWYGMNSEWLDWCKDEMPEWIKKWSYSLEIDMSSILIISNIEELIKFCKTYNRIVQHIHLIDWREVAQDYKGIELINYDILRWADFAMKEFNSHTWVYSWDVNGGCIWDMGAIQDFEKSLITKEHADKS